MTGPALVLLAHGSRDLRHADTVASLAAGLRARRAGLDVRVAYLDHDAPRVASVVAGLGGAPAVVVPLLLGNAFHGRVDVPGALRAALSAHPDARIVLAAVLGPDPSLLPALDRRLAGAGPPADAVVLASAGTGDPAARAAIARLARRWRRPGGPEVVAAYAAGPGPSVGAAVAALRAAGAERVAVASWFLAPGLLYDRARADALAHGAAAVADVLGPAPEVLEVVLRRLDAAGGSARVA